MIIVNHLIEFIFLKCCTRMFLSLYFHHFDDFYHFFYNGKKPIENRQYDVN